MESVAICYLARFVYGLGGESLITARSAYCVAWFSGSILNLAMGIALTVTRLGSTCKKFFHNLPLETSDSFHIAIVTPVIHYTMGGLKINPDAECLGKDDKVIGGLYGTGEAAGGIHGSNRLGGNSLLDCVVFGR